jgi:hypothetical protein
MRGYPYSDRSPVFGVEDQGQRTGPEVVHQRVRERRYIATQGESLLRSSAEHGDRLAGIAAFDLEQVRLPGLPCHKPDDRFGGDEPHLALT